VYMYVARVCKHTHIIHGNLSQLYADKGRLMEALRDVSDDRGQVFAMHTRQICVCVGVCGCVWCM